MGRLPRKVVSNIEPLKLTKLSQFIGKTDEEISSNIYLGIYVDNFDFLKNNFDLFERIVSLKKINKFCANDYEILKYIENNLVDYTDISLSLIDDYRNKDRSYLDLEEFEKTNIEVPFNYLFWNAKANEIQNISYYIDDVTLNPFSLNGYNKITKESLEKLKDKVSFITDKYKKYNDLEKIILVSNYLQNNVQFVAGDNISHAFDGTYITDSKGKDISFLEVSTPECVLFNNFGICNGIALATEILLNNNSMNVNVRSLCGLGHTWNIVRLNNKFYYIDNTWNITRNPNRYLGSLKAKSFTDKYLLFGNDDYDNIINHIPTSLTYDVCDKSVNRKKIARVRKRLSRVEDFDNYNDVVFESKLI